MARLPSWEPDCQAEEQNLPRAHPPARKQLALVNAKCNGFCEAGAQRLLGLLDLERKLIGGLPRVILAF